MATGVPFRQLLVMTISGRRLARWVSQPLAVLAALVFCLGMEAQAQQASGTLTVTATLQSSIRLTFVDNASVGAAGFCPLVNPNTSAASLDLGTASWTGGASSSCVNYVKPAGPATYEVNSAFDVLVQKANTSSPNYRLQVAMSSAPPANVTWLLNSTTLTTATQTLLAAASYGRTTTTLHVQVKNSAAAGVLAETIFFTATAN